MTTTARRDIRSGLVALGEDFKSANPTLLQRVYPRRPRGFTGDLPALYVGSLNEQVRHDSGLRQRTFLPQIGLVCHPTGSDTEVADEVDTLVDYFMDYVTTHPRAAGSNSLVEITEVRDVELEMDEVVYPTGLVVLNYLVLEGRSRAGA
jgi:hypothetical protein